MPTIRAYRYTVSSSGVISLGGSSKQSHRLSSETGHGGFPLAVAIMARDEAEVLGRSLKCLMPQLESGDSLHVVADHCHDNTARVAERAGAIVHRRLRGQPGKGRALAWWVAKLSKAKLKPAGIVVIDADSLAPPDFLASLRSDLKKGHPAVQARVAPVMESDDPVSILAALSEDIEQRVFDRVRQSFGGAIRLRGTGMGFQTLILQQVVCDLKTSVEDAELTLLLLAKGIRVEASAHAYINDPKPDNSMAASRQRARWLQGQWQLMKVHRPSLLRVARQGPAAWSLLSSLFLKPRVLLLPLLLGLTAVSGALLTPGRFAWLLLILLIPVVYNLTGLIIGLATAPLELHSVAWRALPRLHCFMIMWVRSMLLARSSNDPWLRARMKVTKRRIGEATTTGQ